MGVGLINIYTKFDRFGGAQNICFMLHKKLMGDNKLLMGQTSFKFIHKKYPYINQDEYLKFSVKNIIRYKDFIFISHHRKITTYLMLISNIFLLDLKVIHVAHNEFYSHKNLNLFPVNIIAVSNKVKKNLADYFRINNRGVKVIYNGIEDKFIERSSNSYNNQKIRILYPARINKVKQQVQIVKSLRDELSSRITIDFAGTGDDFNKLSQLCEGTSQFNCLGFTNINETISKYDYVMLFSKNEGLPLSLIESCMYGKPILANNVGGNLEILTDSYNGFKLTSFETLAKELNNLLEVSNEEYSQLSKNARKIFTEKFTLCRMCDQYMEVINLVNKI